MKQITEDYCNFEIAKLLKEKGFDIPCRQAYFNSSLVDYTMYGFCDGELLDCPSQSLALKWLREVHKIIISFNASFVNSIEPHFSWNIRINSLKSLNDEEHFEPIYINTKSESFEESCEEALLYVLKNLI